jgi:hypothetical protein
MLQDNYNCIFWGSRSSGSASTENKQCYLYCNTTTGSNNKHVRLISTTTSSTDVWDGGEMTVGEMYTFNNIFCVNTMETMTYTLTLFAFNDIGNIRASNGICRIAQFTAYNNGTKIMDMIPVRKGNIGYMYDKVTGQLFGNQGTGNFVLGPDIYDYEIEYLQSSGTQYINTNLIHTVSNYEYYIDFTPLEDENETCIFGSSKSNYWDGQSWGTTNKLYIGSSKFEGYGFGRQANVRQTIKLVVSGNTINVYKNNIKYFENTFSDSIISGYPIYLFAYTFGSNSASGLCKAKVHAFSIIMNNVKVFDGIPVSKNEVGYMYDKISKKLFGNDGTDEFITGPIIYDDTQNYDAELTYLESSGTQYINCEYIPKGSDKIEVGVRSTTITHNFSNQTSYTLFNPIFGVRYNGSNQFWAMYVKNNTNTNYQLYYYNTYNNGDQYTYYTPYMNATTVLDWHNMKFNLGKYI